MIRSLRPGEKVSAEGITAERTAAGDVRFSVNISVDGQRIHRVVGRESEGVTLTQAREFIAKARTEAREGRLNLPKGRKAHLTFAKAASAYIDRLEKSGGKNIAKKRQHLRDHLVPYFRGKHLKAFSDFAVKGYRRSRLAAGASNATINREVATLNHFFSEAESAGWIDRKPYKVKPLAEGEGRIVVLSDSECIALLTAASEDQDPQLSLFVLFGLNSAMRHEEILSARFENVDSERRRLFIEQAKAGSRNQPLTKGLVGAIEQERKVAIDPDGWIFPGRNPRKRAQYKTRQFRRAVVRAGLDPAKVTPHVLRHTAITKLVQGGADLETVRKISGHKTLAMVLRYTHVSDQHVDNALSAIEVGLPTFGENHPDSIATSPKRKPA